MEMVGLNGDQELGDHTVAGCVCVGELICITQWSDPEAIRILRGELRSHKHVLETVNPIDLFQGPLIIYTCSKVG